MLFFSVLIDAAKKGDLHKVGIYYHTLFFNDKKTAHFAAINANRQMDSCKFMFTLALWLEITVTYRERLQNAEIAKYRMHEFCVM